MSRGYYFNDEDQRDYALVIWCEFGRDDDANAWRKSSKEADQDEDFLLQCKK